MNNCYLNVLVYTTRERSKNKQDNAICRDLFVCISGLFVVIHFAMKTISSLRCQSWDIAQYPKIAKQSNCAILGGSRVAYTNYI